MRLAILFVLASLFVIRANAAPFSIVPINDLPVELQSCIQTNDCIFSLYDGINIYSQLGSDIANAFQYQEAGVDKWLLQYVMLSPPGSISGSAWLSAQNSYDVAGSDAHSFTIYYSGGLVNYGGVNNSGNPTPVTLTLNDADLSAGSAYRLLVPDFEYPEFDIDIGNLSIEPGIALCLATGCGFEATFNLLSLDYSTGSFSFNGTDSRGILFDVNSWYDCGDIDCGSFSVEDRLQVSAVPLPASGLLFVSGGLVVLLGLRKTRRDREI